MLLSWTHWAWSALSWQGENWDLFGPFSSLFLLFLSFFSSFSIFLLFFPPLPSSSLFPFLPYFSFSPSPSPFFSPPPSCPPAPLPLNPLKNYHWLETNFEFKKWSQNWIQIQHLHLPSYRAFIQKKTSKSLYRIRIFMESRTGSDSVCQDLQIYSANRKSQSGTLVLFFWYRKTHKQKQSATSCRRSSSSQFLAATQRHPLPHETSKLALNLSTGACIHEVNHHRSEVNF